MFSFGKNCPAVLQSDCTHPSSEGGVPVTPHPPAVGAGICMELNRAHRCGVNGVDLTEVEDIKKRWQEYTEELYRKIFRTQITMMV